MMFGGLVATLGWLLRFLSGLIRNPAVQDAGIGKFLLFLAIPVLFGAICALCFPMWQRVVKIGNPLAQSTLFWIVVTVVILIGYSFLVFGATATLSSVWSVGFVYWILCAAYAGVCFHLLVSIVVRRVNRRATTA